MNTSIQQGCFKLIKCDNIYNVTIDFYCKKMSAVVKHTIYVLFLPVLKLRKSIKSEWNVSDI